MYRKDFIYSLKSNRGQATVEYVLILVIVVGIIIGGVLKFNKNFNAYASYIFGEYMTCLLETGELPSLGAGESDECPLPKLGATPGLGGNGSGSSGSSSSSKGDGDKDAAKKSAKNSSKKGSGEGSGAGTAENGKSSRSFNANNSSSKNSSPSDESNGNKNEANSKTGSTKAKSRGSSLGAFTTNEDKQIIIYGAALSPQLRAKLDKESSKTLVIQIPEEESGSLAGKKKTLLISKKQGSGIEETQQEPMTFGRMLRIAMILMLIIAILVFVGGQFYQMSQSGEN